MQTYHDFVDFILDNFVPIYVSCLVAIAVFFLGILIMSAQKSDQRAQDTIKYCQDKPNRVVRTVTVGLDSYLVCDSK